MRQTAVNMLRIFFLTKLLTTFLFSFPELQNTLTDYLEQIDCTVEELYREVRETQSETTDPFLKTFIDCLLASADYESFYKVFAAVDITYHISA